MIVPPGTRPLPFAPFASVVLDESNVASWVEQSPTAQTWNVALPVSFVSGSLNAAVNVGVAVLSREPSSGETSTGVLGARFAVLFVNPDPATVAAGLPVGRAVSRTIGSLPGFV